MKINLETKNVSLKGVLATREASIKSGAHIMQILAGLYENPLDAIVREYLSNCNDGYLTLLRDDPDAKILPAIIEIPSKLSPQLVIQDFGVGMDFNTLWEVFTTFGESTKNDNDDDTGGFGIGAKSGLCYNSGTPWMVESVKDGEKHVLMVYISDKQMPSYAHVSTTKTTDHSGVTIKIPILKDDFGQVVESVQNYARFFPMPLTVKGAEITPLDYILRASDKSWGITAEHKDLRIIIGNVPYDYEYTGHFSDYYAFLNQNGVDIQIPIGTADIVPSRDSLKYTDKTKAAILKVLKIMIKEIKIDVNAKIAACTSEWDALETFQAMNRVEGLHEVMGSDLKWNGVELNLVRGVDRLASDLLVLDADAKYDAIGLESSYEATMRGFDFEDASTTAADHHLRVKPDDKTWIVIDDMDEKKGMRYLKRFLKAELINVDAYSKRAKKYGHKIGNAVYLRTTLSPTQLSTFFGGYPVDKMLRASELAKTFATDTTNTGTKKYKGTIYLYKGDSWKSKWAAGVDVPSTTGYYLPLTQDDNRRFSYGQSVQHLLNTWQEMGEIAGVPIYGVKAADASKFDALGWTNFHTAVDEHVLAIALSRPNELAAIETKTDGAVDSRLVNTIEAIDLAGLKHPAVEQYLKIAGEDAPVIADDIQAVHDFLYTHKLAIQNTLDTVEAVVHSPTVVNVTDLAEQIIAAYPILQFLMDVQKSYTMCAIENHKDLLLDFCKTTV
jgi:hypothetical protein